VELEFADADFCGEREKVGRKTSKQGENRRQTQPTYDRIRVQWLAVYLLEIMMSKERPITGEQVMAIFLAYKITTAIA